MRIALPLRSMALLCAPGHASRRHCHGLLSHDDVGAPNALRRITQMRGNGCLCVSKCELGTVRIIPRHSRSLPGRNPGVSTSVVVGTLNASQSRTKRRLLRSRNVQRAARNEVDSPKRPRFESRSREQCDQLRATGPQFERVAVVAWLEQPLARVRSRIAARDESCSSQSAVFGIVSFPMGGTSSA